jgi:hypothetical protein
LHAIDPTSSKNGPLISHGTAFTQCVLQIRETYCADQRDKLFAIAGLPLFRLWSRVATFPIDYRMSIEESCAAALSFYDQLAKEDIRAGKFWSKDQPSEVLGGVIRWFVEPQDNDDSQRVNNLLRRFVFWLRNRVEADGGAIYLAPGEVIDCSGVILEALLYDFDLERLPHGYASKDLLE